MTQLPIATNVTVLPLTVQTAVVSDEKITANPEEAVALRVKGGVPKARSLNAPKVMV